MSDHLMAFCAARKHAPYLRKLTKETIGWTAMTEYPSGAWTKGSTTLCLTRWFLQCCQELRAQLPRDALLFECWEATLEIYHFFAKLYREGVWIESARALEISAHGLKFLRLHGLLAHRAFREQKALFIYMPNLHRLHELFFLLQDYARKSEYAISPLIWGCQVEEDFIGRPSRVSRRVNSRRTMLRTLQRSLEAAYASFVESGLLIPG